MNLRDAFTACALDAAHLSMILQRIIFEETLLKKISYQAASEDTVPTDEDDAIQLKDDKERQQLHINSLTDTLTWLAACVSSLKRFHTHSFTDLSKENMSSFKFLLDRLDYLQIIWTTGASLRDFFFKMFELYRSGRPLDSLGTNSAVTIDEPNIHLGSIKPTLEDFKRIEDAYTNIIAQLDADDETHSSNTTLGAKLKAQVDEFKPASKKRAKELSAQYETVLHSRQLLKDQRPKTSKAIESVWRAQSSKFSCHDVIGVLEAIGSVCMFVHGGFGAVGAVFKAGSALSVGASLTGLGSSMDTSQGNVKKDALHGKFLVIEREIADDSLKEEISMKSRELTQMTDVDKEYVNSIIVNKNAFRQLCNSYFLNENNPGVDEKEIVEAKKAFDQYVSDAQAYFDAVAKYNKIFHSIAEAALANLQAESGLAQLQSGSFTKDIAVHDLLYTLYSTLYASQKAVSLELIFDAARAFSCVFLKRCRALDDLLVCQSWSGLTADVIQDAFVTRLRNEVNAYRKTVDGKAHLTQRRTISLTYETHEAYLNSLRKTGKLSFFLNDKIAVDQFGFNKHWYDMRLLDIQVYLVGATNKQAGKNADTKTIDVGIKLGGVFFVHDKDFNKHTFEVIPSDLDFTYKYGKADDAATFTPDTEDDMEASKALRQFNFAMNDDGPSAWSTPVRSPYLHYLFEVEDPTEHSNVSEIILKFNFKARMGKRPQPAATTKSK